VDSADLALSADIPWWDPVDPDNWTRLQSECRLFDSELCVIFVFLHCAQAVEALLRCALWLL
jgi:hypothetical protein